MIAFTVITALKLRTRRVAGLAKFQLMQCALNTALGIKYGACRAILDWRVGKILHRDSFIVGRRRRPRMSATRKWKRVDTRVRRPHSGLLRLQNRWHRSPPKVPW